MKVLAFYLFGAANIAMGVLNLVWGDFDPAHQPVQALSDRIPGQSGYAYLTGALLVAGGAAMVSRSRWAAWGALVLAVVNLAVAVFWLPRLYTAPHYLGVTVPVVTGVLGGAFRQAIIVCAALLAYATLASDRLTRSEALTGVARWVFGLGSIDFGLVHLTSVAVNAPYVPVWMPFGRDFWVFLTGAAFILAGIAIIVRLFDVTAARLLGLMLLVFSAFTLLPNLTANVHDLGSWGGNVHEFVLVGSAWIFSEWLAEHANARVGQRVPV
ncbi:MAG TPA: hypothetical protein VGZ02_02715 [Candidatus Baltobacteraceae bacterium]|jgi:uncharacterized membrane protein|nr:hypothetical protein [Candidatus Baltobacteraceae bacterium]